LFVLYDSMFSKGDVKRLASEACTEFSRKHKVSCKVSLIDLDEFWKLAKKSRIIQDDMKKRIPLKVGALVLHGEKEEIYLNEDIMNNLTKDPNFVKSIVLHELFHVYFRNYVKEDSLEEDIKSENRVELAVKKEFPKYSKYSI
jgi:hypothetical protein